MSSVRTEPFTGFGDDPNWSVKFSIQGQPGSVRDWDSKPRTAVLTPATGNRTIRQRRGRDPWSIEVELLFDSSDELEALDALVGTKATLRCRWGTYKRMGGALEMIGSDAYLALPDTYLASLDEHTGYINSPGGRRKATARFERDYIDPAPFTPPVWPPAPPPIPLPTPVLFLSPTLMRNRLGPVSPAISGSVQTSTLDGVTAWLPQAGGTITLPVASIPGLSSVRGTAYVVAKRGTASHDGSLLEIGNRTSGEDTLVVRSSPAPAGAMVMGGAVSNAWTEDNYTVFPNDRTWRFLLDWDGTSIRNRRANGSINAMTRATPTGVLAGNLDLGFHASNSWLSEIGAIVIYDRRLTDLERTQLDATALAAMGWVM